MAASDEHDVDSDLGGCLEDLVPAQDNSPHSCRTSIIFDGASISNMFRLDYADIFLFTIQVFLPYTSSQLQRVSRLVVWDEHLADSLKAETRTRRGKCIRCRLSLYWQRQYRVFHFGQLVSNHCYWQTSRQHISHWCAPRHIRPYSIHSRRSRYTNPTPPGRVGCCETRVWQDTHSHSWHGCGSSFNDISPALQHNRTVDCIWCSEELPIFTGPRDGQRTGSGQLCFLVNVSCLHWLWYSVMFWKQRQTGCMGHVECLWRSHTSFLCFGCYPGDRR